MKKIFTLFAATMMAASVFAQQPYVLDANRILKTYIQHNGTSVVNDEDHDMTKAFNKNRINIPVNFSKDPVNLMNKVSLTADYTDSETGFTVPAGDYTGMCSYTWWNADTQFYKDTQLEMCFYNNDYPCINNIKKMIVYVAGNTPSSCEGGVLSSYQSLRVTGTNIFVDGAKYTNSVSGDKATENWLGKSIAYGLPEGGTADIKDETRSFTQDKLIKIVIDLATPHDPDNFSELDGKGRMRSANDDDNPTEKAKAKIVDSNGMATATEYNYTITHKFEDTTGDGNNQKPGYYSYDIPWAKNVGYALQLKKYAIIFGVAFISGEDGAKTYIGDTTLGRDAKWEELGTTGINSVNAESAKVAPRKQIVNGQIVIGNYNIAGQRVK